jgi:hypothetical protein
MRMRAHMPGRASASKTYIYIILGLAMAEKITDNASRSHAARRRCNDFGIGPAAHVAYVAECIEQDVDIPATN